MAERLISKRLKFSNGQQKGFINQSQEKLRLNLKELANLLKINTRTLSDWKREKFLISLKAARILSRKSRIKIPQDVKIRKEFWYTTKGAKKGGTNMYKKYGRVGGDPEIRKRKWQEWWKKEGQFKKHPIMEPLSIKKPSRSEKLAEFVGIVMGDGGISKNQVIITLNLRDDKEYIRFVTKLIKNLFGIEPSIYRYSKSSVDDIVVSRVMLVKFCVEELGLKIGNKIRQQIDIPDWIKKYNKFQTACVRGLVDTDGSVFIHKYFSGNKYYQYKKMDFTSRSLPLLNSVSLFLNKIGIKHRLCNKYQIRIESQEEVKKYFLIIGSHNQKHLKKYKLRI